MENAEKQRHAEKIDGNNEKFIGKFLPDFFAGRHLLFATLCSKVMGTFTGKADGRMGKRCV
jgi:hypothetical protein